MVLEEVQSSLQTDLLLQGAVKVLYRALQPILNGLGLSNLVTTALRLLEMTSAVHATRAFRC